MKAFENIVIKEEKSVESDVFNVEIEPDSQENVVKDEDNEMISEDKDEEFAEGSEDEEIPWNQINQKFNKSSRMGTLIKFSIKK